MIHVKISIHFPHTKCRISSLYKCAIHSSFSRCSSTIWSTLFARECFLSCLKNKNCVFFLSTLRITTDFQTTSESTAYSQRPAPFPLKNMRCHLLFSRKKTPQKILYYIFHVFLTHLLLRSPASESVSLHPSYHPAHH